MLHFVRFPSQTIRFLDHRRFHLLGPTEFSCRTLGSPSLLLSSSCISCASLAQACDWQIVTNPEETPESPLAEQERQGDVRGSAVRARLIEGESRYWEQSASSLSSSFSLYYASLALPVWLYLPHACTITFPRRPPFLPHANRFFFLALSLSLPPSRFASLL